MKKHGLPSVYNEQLRRVAFGGAWFLFLHIKATSTSVNETPSGSSQRGRLVKLIHCKITLEIQVDENFVWHFRNLTDRNLCVCLWTLLSIHLHICCRQKGTNGRE